MAFLLETKSPRLGNQSDTQYLLYSKCNKNNAEQRSDMRSKLLNDDCLSLCDFPNCPIHSLFA